MQDLSTRLKIMPTFLAAALLFVFGCDSGAPPPSPPASATTSEDAEGTTKSKSKTLSKSEELDDDESKDDDEEEETKSSKFNFGGAKIGEKDVIDAVEKCLESGKFYNRFDEDEALGKCTKLALAKVDCDSKGLKKVLSDKQLEQFNSAMNDDTTAGYKGWTIDQCLDCAKGSDEPLCQNSSGKEQVGTKVFFLQVADAETKGKSMVLPVRPGQD
jgi:hypothetical protein